MVRPSLKNELRTKCLRINKKDGVKHGEKTKRKASLIIAIQDKLLDSKALRRLKTRPWYRETLSLLSTQRTFMKLQIPEHIRSSALELLKSCLSPEGVVRKQKDQLQREARPVLSNQPAVAQSDLTADKIAEALQKGLQPTVDALHKSIDRMDRRMNHCEQQLEKQAENQQYANRKLIRRLRRMEKGIHLPSPMSPLNNGYLDP